MFLRFTMVSCLLSVNLGFRDMQSFAGQVGGPSEGIGPNQLTYEKWPGDKSGIGLPTLRMRFEAKRVAAVSVFCVGCRSIDQKGRVEAIVLDANGRRILHQYSKMLGDQGSDALFLLVWTPEKEAEVSIHFNLSGGRPLHVRTN